MLRHGLLHNRKASNCKTLLQRSHKLLPGGLSINCWTGELRQKWLIKQNMKMRMTCHDFDSPTNSDITFPWVLWHCWLGDSKDIRPVKRTGCWFVGGDTLTGPPPPSPLALIKSRIETFWYQLTQVHLENGRQNRQREREWHAMILVYQPTTISIQELTIFLVHNHVRYSPSSESATEDSSGSKSSSYSATSPAFAFSDALSTFYSHSTVHRIFPLAHLRWLLTILWTWSRICHGLQHSIRY